MFKSSYFYYILIFVCLWLAQCGWEIMRDERRYGVGEVGLAIVNNGKVLANVEPDGKLTLSDNVTCEQALQAIVSERMERQW